MATTANINYGASATVTISLASLAWDSTNLTAGRASSSITNVSSLAIDYLVGGKIVAGSTSAQVGQIEIWSYGTYDGTNFVGGATGTDANLTPDSKTAMKLLGIIPTVATSNKAYTFGPYSINAAFGNVPNKWGIYIVHNSCTTLHSTAGQHTVVTYPIFYTSS